MEWILLYNWSCAVRIPPPTWLTASHDCTEVGGSGAHVQRLHRWTRHHGARANRSSVLLALAKQIGAVRKFSQGANNTGIGYHANVRWSSLKSFLRPNSHTSTCTSTIKTPGRKPPNLTSLAKGNNDVMNPATSAPWSFHHLLLLFSARCPFFTPPRKVSVL